VDEQELRGRCRDLLRELDVQPPLDVADMAWRLGQLRGRPVKLEPRALQRGGSFGCVFPMPSQDLLIYQSAATAAYRNHIVFHELTHLFLGHVDRHVDRSNELRVALVCGSLGEQGSLTKQGTLYDSPPEWEAETAATIFSEWAATVTAAAAVPEGDGTAQRLGLALGDTRGWG